MGRRIFYLSVILIFGIPLLFLSYQAIYNPKIDFLFPSLHGKWIMHPVHKDISRKYEVKDEPISKEVAFRRQFNIDSPPKNCTVKVRALKQFRMVVNGKIVEPNSSLRVNSWKKSLKYNLLPYLRSGENTIEIFVKNCDPPRVHHGKAEPPVALLVEETDLGIQSDLQWEAALEPDFENWRSPVIALKLGSDIKNRKGELQLSKRYGLYKFLFSIYVFFTILAVISRRVYIKILPLSIRSLLYGKTKKRCESKRKKILFISLYATIIIIVLTINIHNIIVYPYKRAHFDWWGHVPYIQRVTSTWRPPVATDGWEMFQPPFYYFLSAFVYKLWGAAKGEPHSLKAVQFLGMTGVMNALFGLLVLRKVFSENHRAQALGFSVVAFLPMGFYMNPLISNEVFSGFMISMGIYLIIRYGFEQKIRLWQYAVIGVVVGLGLLSKYTALFIFLSACLVFLFKLIHGGEARRKVLIGFAIFLTVCGILSGWLYVRNFILFHDPFVGNWDESSGFRYEEHPNYRTLGFYARFGSVFFNHPNHSVWTSFWDGMYGTMWMDAFENFLSLNNREVNFTGGILLYLAFLPTVALLLGFLQAVRKFVKSRGLAPETALVLVTFFTLVSMLSFSMEVPCFQVLKAFFAISLLPAMALFFGSGLETMCENLGRLRFLVYINLIVLYGVIINLFWYRGT